MDAVTAVRQELGAAQARVKRLETALAALGGTDVARRARAPENTVSLRAAILAELQRARKPLALTPLAQAVTAAGFKSASRNFRSNVSAMLTQMVRRGEVKRGAEGYSAAASKRKVG